MRVNSLPLIAGNDNAFVGGAANAAANAAAAAYVVVVEDL